MLHHEPENEFSSFSGNLCIGLILTHSVSSIHHSKHTEFAVKYHKYPPIT